MYPVTSTTKHRIEVSTHKGGDLFEIITRKPRTPRTIGATVHENFNLQFKYNERDQHRLSGGGIYSIFFKGELLYIGIFTGKNKIPFAADVASERYYKHLEALTLRGRSVGLTIKNYDLALKLDRPDSVLMQMLRDSSLLRGNGAVKTYPCKVEFAGDNWKEFSRIEHDQSILNDFTFVYGRSSAEHFTGKPTYQQIKNYLGEIENGLVKKYNPRCNLKVTRGNESYLAIGPARDSWSSFEHVIASQII